LPQHLGLPCRSAIAIAARQPISDQQVTQHYRKSMRSKGHKEGSHPGTQLIMGVFVVVISTIALAGLLHGAAADGLAGGSSTPSGFWWGLILLLGSCLAVGLVWTITGIRGTFLPTSFLYRLTDLPGLLERLTRGR
jgi:hypothetical protein